MIMWVISAVMALVFGLGIGGMVTAPAVGMTHQTPDTSKQDTDYSWDAFHADAVSEYEAQLTALYEGYETKWSKNGRLMIRTGNSGPYKFVRKAA
ncbi:hypothetical protein [Streptomyces ardesiacus]|uniref:hypothetical protein n=1 Tax=Streptomyces ardesiacus TaxID=285564 RepID=UPI003666537F